MTTIESNSGAVSATNDEAAAGSFFSDLGAWLSTSDHKRVGRLFVGTSLVGLLATVVVGLLLGVERIDGSQVLLDAGAIPELFQAFRIGLVFGSLLPLGVGLAIAVVPLQLGARALTFPRLALTGFYSWLAGLVLVIVALTNNGGIGGADVDMVGLFLLGHALMALGLLAAAGCIATTVLTTRAPGMTMRRVPFFSWAALVNAIGLLLALPVMLGTILYLFIDLRNTAEAFGGSDGIGVWLGWVFTQPTTFLFALPALGVAAELVPVTFGRRMRQRGVLYAGLALVGVAAFAGVTQQNIFNLPWPGAGLNFDDFGDKLLDLVPFAIFNLLPVLGVLIVMAVGALSAAGGRPRISSPFLFSFFGLGMVFVGMLGNVLYAIDDLGLQGTVFEEASLVYVSYGAALGVMGGVAYWAPKLWGRRMPEAQLIPLALLGVLATVLASFPYFIAGFADQPANAAEFSYSGPEALWNILVLAGHALMLLTVVGFVASAVAAFRSDGEPAGDDPWDAHTIEWTTTSPAPGNNYPEVPAITSAEPLLDLKVDEPSTTGSQS
jgi:heme/copper-type cytochrome/quinol oxidase subunit 1